ncbi:MAG: DUF2764 family protein [Bacteroidales bacterium]|nr:DUF2764 family protein [Candidatus Cryptobacteroides aphodequi]
MNNYEYIIASLPVLSADYRGPLDCGAIMEEIASQLSKSDSACLQTLMDSWNGDNLTPDFYAKALASRNRFIREYFAWDLGVRNCKVEYLNKALGRPEGQDVMVLEGASQDEEFEGRAEAMAALGAGDLIKRERALDDLMWDKIDELTLMDVFTLDVILAFAAKMQIINRWLSLDEQTGREMFRRLVEEIRNNKKPIE